MNNIKELMDKYWNADTNPEEENMIKEYFASGDVDPEYSEYVHYFNYLQSQQNKSRDFNPMAKVEKLMTNNSNFEDKEKLPKETKMISLVRRWQAVAAMMIFSLLCLWGVRQYIGHEKSDELITQSTKKARIIEINDPEEALEYTEDAMNLIASMLRTGTDPVGEGLEKINQTPVIGDLQ